MDSGQRLRRLAGGCGALLAAGLLYALWVDRTGLALPCPVRTASGLLCPGCGMTRLCLALLRMDLAGAWQANPALLLMLPGFGLLAGRLAVRYIREGKAMPQGWETVLLWVLLAMLVVWGVVRNLI